MSKYHDLVKKLKEVFQIDKPQLDFGIYRILNSRVDEINDYLENRLSAKVKESLSQANAQNLQHIEQALHEATKNAQSLGMNPDDAPKVVELRQQLVEQKGGASDHENAVYSHLLTFFSRYYEKGDFISQRRYKGDTYAVPYAGEEVVLHWANKDQYYTKSGENFSNYAFKLEDGRTVRCRLVSADTAKDNRKDNDKERRFVLIEPHTRTQVDEEGDEFEENLIPIEEINGELVLRFEYRAMPKGSKQEDLVSKAVETVLGSSIVQTNWPELQTLEPTEKKPTRTLLEKALTNYTAKNTADYFIHKDLGSFLRRELDFYIKNEVMNLDDVQDAQVFKDIEKNLRLIQTLRAIAKDLITFLAQLEDFQKKLWLKRKFVVAAHYCMTLDRVPESLYPKIAENSQQWQQWQSLGMLFKATSASVFNQAEEGTVDYLKANPFLMVDTALFDSSFKYELLASISDLDENLDGLLIHGDNFQAMNLLQERYREQVKCVYIDPPYNTGGDDFIYKDNYQHSSWLSLMSDRLVLSKQFMKKEGSFSMSIDFKELDKAVSTLDLIYGEDNRKNLISIKRASCSGAKVINLGVVNVSEYVLLYSIDSDSWKPERAFRQKGYDSRYGGMISNFDDGYENWRFESVLDSFSLFKGIKKSKLKTELGDEYEQELQEFVIENATSVIRFASLDEGSVSKEAVELKKLSLINPEKIFYLNRGKKSDYYILKGNVMLFYKDRLANIGGKLVPCEPISDIWDDVLPNDLHNEGGVSLKKGKKPEKLINRILDSSLLKNEIVLDFFAGSGTTAAVAQKTGRKWLAIEAGEYFDTTTKTRLLKTIGGESSGISNEVNWKGGGFFKVLQIESYEDTLNNLELKRSPQQIDLLSNLPDSVREDYLLRYMLDIESRDSLLSVDDFKKPFDYKLKIAIDSAGAYEERNIDLIETFNYLIGLRVESITMQSDKGFATIEGVLPTGEKTLVLWRDVEKVDYEALNKICDKLKINPKDSEFEVIYINGDHNIPTTLTALEDEGGITKTLKLRQIEPEFLRLMFETI